MTFGTLKSRIGLLLVDFQIQNTIGGRFDMTPGTFTRTRFHPSPCALIEGVQRADIVTTRTAQARVRDPFVSKLRRMPRAPFLQHKLVVNPHCRRELRIKVVVRLCQRVALRGRQKLMTCAAFGRGRL